MKTNAFKKLLKSIDEARAIRAGRRKPSRAQRFRAALRQVNRRHRKTLQSLAGISARWQKRLGSRTFSDSAALIREDRSR